MLTSKDLQRLARERREDDERAGRERWLRTWEGAGARGCGERGAVARETEKQRARRLGRVQVDPRLKTPTQMRPGG